MRTFNYKKYVDYKWDNEILSYLTQIYEYKGKQELYSRQRPVELERLVEVAKVQSVESSNRIEGIIRSQDLEEGIRSHKIISKKLVPMEQSSFDLLRSYRMRRNPV